MINWLFLSCLFVWDKGKDRYEWQNAWQWSWIWESCISYMMALKTSCQKWNVRLSKIIPSLFEKNDSIKSWIQFTDYDIHDMMKKSPYYLQGIVIVYVLIKCPIAYVINPRKISECSIVLKCHVVCALPCVSCKACTELLALCCCCCVAGVVLFVSCNACIMLLVLFCCWCIMCFVLRSLSLCYYGGVHCFQSSVLKCLMSKAFIAGAALLKSNIIDVIEYVLMYSEISCSYTVFSFRTDSSHWTRSWSATVCWLCDNKGDENENVVVLVIVKSALNLPYLVTNALCMRGSITYLWDPAVFGG